ncbi:MAG: N-formylglutamate amidohydrolase [Pseudomonadota bacterium]
MDAEIITADTFLEPGEPGPFDCLHPESESNVVLICDHASKRIPNALDDLGLEYQNRERHIAWDMGAGPLTRYLSRRLGAVAVLANYSRLVMDLNRNPDSDDAYPSVSDITVVPANQNLSPEAQAIRRAALFDPYHNAIETQLDAVRARGVCPALVAIHSYTQELLSGGGERPWHIGVLYDKDVRIAHRLIESLSRNPLVEVGDNEPYSGTHYHDYSIDTHGEAARIACCGIEVRQDLLATRESFNQWATILGDALAETLADPVIYESTCAKV